MNRMQRPYKAVDFPPLSDEQKRTLENIDKLKDSEIDTSDSPECSGNGGFYYIQSLKMPQTKIYTAVDNDNLEWLKKVGKGYQQRLNNVLRWARMNGCPVGSL
jgi:uncharacterized protein (DUF4415 family)